MPASAYHAKALSVYWLYVVCVLYPNICMDMIFMLGDWQSWWLWYKYSTLPRFWQVEPLGRPNILVRWPEYTLHPPLLVLVYFQCAQYTSQMAKVCLSFPLPSLLPERLMEPGATKSRSPGAEQATQVCVYLIVTHTAEPFLQAATLISIG